MRINLSDYLIENIYLAKKRRDLVFYEGGQEQKFQNVNYGFKCPNCTSNLNLKFRNFENNSLSKLLKKDSNSFHSINQVSNLNFKQFPGMDIIETIDEVTPYYSIKTCELCLSEYLLIIGFDEIGPHRYFAHVQSISKITSKTNPLNFINQEKLNTTDIDKTVTKLDDLTLKKSERFVKGYGNKYDNEFDYSQESLLYLDELLVNFSDFQNEFSDKAINKLIEQAGSYIFQIAIKKFSGILSWYKPLNQPILLTGLPDFEIGILVFDIVRQRIENQGNDTYLPNYFKGYSEKVRTGVKGESILII